MNILYFAPYNNQDETGYLSRYYANQLSKTHQLTVCPITTDTNTNQAEDNPYNKILDTYDITIQQCPYTYFNPIENTKNIWLPIIYNLSLISDHTFIKNLTQIDTILVDDIYTEYVIARSGFTVPIKSFNPLDGQIVSFDSQQKLDLGLYNHAKKYYSICNYDLDHLAIVGLMKYFLSVFRGDLSKCLILLITCNQGQAETLQAHIKNIAQELKLADYSNIKIFATLTGSLEDYAAIHNIGDIYLDLTRYNNIYHKLLASQFNSDIINRKNIGFFDNYGDQHQSMFAYMNNIISWCSDAYADTFEDIKTPQINSHYPTLSEVIGEL